MRNATTTSSKRISRKATSSRIRTPFQLFQAYKVAGPFPAASQGPEVKKWLKAHADNIQANLAFSTYRLGKEDENEIVLTLQDVRKEGAAALRALEKLGRSEVSRGRSLAEFAKRHEDLDSSVRHMFLLLDKELGRRLPVDPPLATVAPRVEIQEAEPPTSGPAQEPPRLLMPSERPEPAPSVLEGIQDYITGTPLGVLPTRTRNHLRRAWNTWVVSTHGWTALPGAWAVPSASTRDLDHRMTTILECTRTWALAQLAVVLSEDDDGRESNLLAPALLEVLRTAEDALLLMSKPHPEGGCSTLECTDRAELAYAAFADAHRRALHVMREQVDLALAQNVRLLDVKTIIEDDTEEEDGDVEAAVLDEKPDDKGGEPPANGPTSTSGGNTGKVVEITRGWKEKAKALWPIAASSSGAVMFALACPVGSLLQRLATLAGLVLFGAPTWYMARRAEQTHTAH